MQRLALDYEALAYGRLPIAILQICHTLLKSEQQHILRFEDEYLRGSLSRYGAR
jgi:hypothetical protein